MARVKGPNGLVLTMPDDVAAGLVNSPSGEYEYVRDEQKKSTATKPSSKK